ncbi:hypothetical protein HT749_06795 [Burkholderia cepacia]|uniref:hypothetical protein n=1 Tax=Burkholderia cepacia TaxID=292 RepID=UPI00157B5247|nr:hypothetical protein [Burkholderia cepacia]NTX43105.1 hypothetical protein [Burkholderia cepacia]
MRKTLLTAAFVAAPIVVATAAHASLFGSDPKPAPAPYTLLDSLDLVHAYSTYSAKVMSANALVYDRSSVSLMGLRLGDPLPAACPKVPNKHVCILQSNAQVALASGLVDNGGIVQETLPGVPVASTLPGQALVATDSSGRIDAIVVPLVPKDDVARIAMQGFQWRFGDPTGNTATRASWDFPNGVSARVVYYAGDRDHLAQRHRLSPTQTKTLYVAINTEEGDSKVYGLLNADWSVIPPTK